MGGPDQDTATTRLKLGILVVYLTSPENEWVLDKHLAHLADTRPFMEFTVYGTANRLSPHLRAKLDAYPFVRILDLPSVRERESAEHGTYLDLMAAQALADGCDYLCTFDVDSWPIEPDWIERCHTLLTRENGAAVAVLRAENGDSVLPHPCFTFIRAALFRDQGCRFWMPEQLIDRDYHAFFIGHRQHPDTGAGIGYFLHRAGLRWIPLTRSNKRNYHYLMGGIYGDLVFHVGASSRQGIVFRRDDMPWITRVGNRLAALPLLWRIAPTVLRLLKTTYEPGVRRRNRQAFDLISARLRSDEAAFYADLRGHGAEKAS